MDYKTLVELLPIVFAAIAVVLTLIYQGFLFGSRRNNDREYNERFNMYKVLVVDKIPAQIERLHADFLTHTAKIPLYRSWITFGDTHFVNEYYHEVQSSHSSFEKSFILPIKVFDPELYESAKLQIESMYNDLQEMLDVEEERIQQMTWSTKLAEYLKLLGDSTPRHSVGFFRRRYRGLKKIWRKYKKWIDMINPDL